MKKAKRILCIIMAAVIFVTAPVTSYMEARAVEVTVLPLVEDLLLSLGITFGLGEQSDFFSDARQQALDDFMSAAASGGTITLPEFGIVDFSSSTSIMSFLDYSLRCNMLLLGEPVDLPQSTYSDMALALDQISYHNSGTSATNAMNDCIEEFYNDYSGSSETLVEDIQDCFSIIMQGGDFTAADDEKSARMLKIWNTFNAVMAAGMIGFGHSALPISALKEYGNSEFNEYDAVFGEAYFDGSYDMTADGQYIYKLYSDVYLIDKNNHNAKVRWCVDVVLDEQVAGYVLNDRVHFVTARGKVSLPVANSSLGYPYISNSGYSGNMPVYSTQDAAINALKAGDFSDAENIQSSYADFKKNTGSARAVVGNPFANYVASLGSFSDLAEIIPGIKEASDTYGGTAEMLPEIAKILSEAGDAAISKPGVDDPDDSSSGNYSGILGKILAAINNILTTTKSIPLTLVTLLAGKFMTADVLTSLLNGLPAMFSAAYSEVLNLALHPVLTAFDALPLSLANAIAEVFPAYDDAIDAILDLPKTLLEAVKGITITVPDIVIPEIAIPDIVIPEIAVPEIVIPEIAIPDVFVDIPAITLDPTYEITVKNDFLGLGDIISNAVQKVLEDVFVPNEAVTLEKVDTMKEYFKFKDDITEAVDTMKTVIFGITPSPILKIPIGKTTSKKYNYGTGSYIIIDVSWYAPYKQFGDKVILAIAWALFLWRLFLKLPGIISGTEGSIMAADRSYQRYSSGKD